MEGQAQVAGQHPWRGHQLVAEAPRRDASGEELYPKSKSFLILRISGKDRIGPFLEVEVESRSSGSESSDPKYIKDGPPGGNFAKNLFILKYSLHKIMVEKNFHPPDLPVFLFR